MKRIAISTPFLAAAFAAGAAHGQSAPGPLETFQLPPGQEKLPEMQGPETSANPLPRNAPPVRVAAPAANQPTQTESETADSKEATARAAADSSSQPTQNTPAPATGQESQSPPRAPQTRATTEPARPMDAASESSPPAEITQEPPPRTAAPPTAVPAPRLATPEAEPSGFGFGFGRVGGWEFAFILLLLVPMAIAGLLFLRNRPLARRKELVLPSERPEPRPRPAPQPSPEAGMEPAPQPPESGEDEEDEEGKTPLSHAMEATSLSVTLLNATLSYRLTLSNRSDRMIRNIAISGDMVSAHSAMPVEQQLAGPDENLAPLHRIQALLPGQSAFLNGQMRLPIGAIQPLHREQAVLFVPLARMRIEASDMETVLLRTSVVGQRPAGPGAGLRPFRLDLGPRIYSDLGQRALSLPA